MKEKNYKENNSLSDFIFTQPDLTKAEFNGFYDGTQT